MSARGTTRRCSSPVLGCKPSDQAAEERPDLPRSARLPAAAEPSTARPDSWGVKVLDADLHCAARAGSCHFALEQVDPKSRHRPHLSTAPGNPNFFPLSDKLVTFPAGTITKNRERVVKRHVCGHATKKFLVLASTPSSNVAIADPNRSRDGDRLTNPAQVTHLTKKAATKRADCIVTFDARVSADPPHRPSWQPMPHLAGAGASTRLRSQQVSRSPPSRSLRQPPPP